MKEPINHKALKMNINPKRQNSFFITPPKPVTKRNKRELTKLSVSTRPLKKIYTYELKRTKMCGNNTYVPRCLSRPFRERGVSDRLHLWWTCQTGVEHPRRTKNTIQHPQNDTERYKIACLATAGIQTNTQ